MESKSNQSHLVVVVGETASGKTALALELALLFDGEIIAADSRTLYKGMDIGTAKSTPEERATIRHHLIDISTPDKPITAAEYKKLADQTIEEVANRGKLPILVGGTGLYIDAVIYDFSFSGKPNEQERKRLQAMTVNELQEELRQLGVPLPVNSKNPRHLIRQLETGGVPAAPRELRPNTLIVGIDIEREVLRERIVDRTEAMLQNGLEKEVRHLMDMYGSDCPPLQTIGYQEFVPYFTGKETIKNVREAIVRNTMQYAKRQRTWFRRNNSIHRICKKEEAVDLVTTLLNKVPVAKQRSLLQ